MPRIHSAILRLPDECIGDRRDVSAHNRGCVFPRSGQDCGVSWPGDDNGQSLADGAGGVSRSGDTALESEPFRGAFQGFAEWAAVSCMRSGKGDHDARAGGVLPPLDKHRVQRRGKRDSDVSRAGGGFREEARRGEKAGAVRSGF